MGDNQRADVVNGEINREIRCAGTLGFLLPLKEATVDKETSGGVLLGAKSKLVAGASNARGGAVVGYIYHGQQSLLYLPSLIKPASGESSSQFPHQTLHARCHYTKPSPPHPH